MSETETTRVLLYSDDAVTRRHVIDSVGRRAAKDLPIIEWDETATGPAVVGKVEENSYDLLVLDGEAAKVGGMALAKQLKNEIFECPPILMLIGRPLDEWLSHWSQSDAFVHAPYEPLALQEAIAGQLREQFAKASQ